MTNVVLGPSSINVSDILFLIAVICEPSSINALTEIESPVGVTIEQSNVFDIPRYLGI